MPQEGVTFEREDQLTKWCQSALYLKSKTWIRGTRRTWAPIAPVARRRSLIAWTVRVSLCRSKNRWAWSSSRAQPSAFLSWSSSSKVCCVVKLLKWKYSIQNFLVWKEVTRGLRRTNLVDPNLFSFSSKLWENKWSEQENHLWRKGEKERKPEARKRSRTKCIVLCRFSQRDERASRSQSFRGGWSLLCSFVFVLVELCWVSIYLMFY